MELQETLPVPEPVIVAGLIAEHVSPVGSESERLTVPLNPFMETIVSAEATVERAFTIDGAVAVRV